MPYLPSLPANAAPPTVYKQYPEIYGPWSTMSEALMNGPSPLSPAERELVLAYAAAVAGCDFVGVAHSEVAYALGIEQGLVERLVENFDATSAEPRLKALLAFAGKLAVTPTRMAQVDADAFFAGGWDEKALHDVIAITARAAFMQRLAQGFGFVPLSREAAAKHAHKRVQRGYVNLYGTFRTEAQN